MFGSLCLIALGSVLTLYFTQEKFRTRVNELGLYGLSLFKRKETAPQTEEPTNPSPDVPPLTTP